MFNFMVSSIFIILSYENTLRGLFHWTYPSIIKLLIFLYVIYLLYYIKFANLKIKFTINKYEAFLFLFLLVAIIFMYLNPLDGFKYVVSFFILFLFFYLLKYIKNKLDFIKIVKIIVYFNIPLLLINFMLTFDYTTFYTQHSLKHQFFGTFGNPNTLGVWLSFLLVVNYFLINQKIKFLIFWLIFYLVLATLSRSTMVFFIIMFFLYYYNNKKVIFYFFTFISVIFIILLNVYYDEFTWIKSLLYRLHESSNRPYSDMIELVRNNEILPYGTNIYQNFTKNAVKSLDNSYFSLLVNYGFLGVLYLIPFILILFKGNYIFRLIVFAFLFQSFFERTLVSNVDPLLLFIIFILFVFPENIKCWRIYEKNTYICR